MLGHGRAEASRVRHALRTPCRENPGTMIRRTRAALVQGHTRRAAILARHGFAATGDRRLGALLSEIEERKDDLHPHAETA
jgi:hypothetical protein